MHDTKAQSLTDEPASQFLLKRDKNSSGGGGTTAPFIIFVIIAVGLVLSVVIMIVVRITYWKRHGDDMSQHPSSVVYAPFAVPKDNVSPPPIYEKKIVLPSDGASLPQWQMLQPLSVSLNKAASEYIRINAHAPESLLRKHQSDPVPFTTQVQTSFFISLPSQHSCFPDRLRAPFAAPRHPLAGDTRTSMELELSHDLSTFSVKPSRAPSVHSKQSVKEVGDARRDAFFSQLEGQGGTTLGFQNTVRSRSSALEQQNQEVLDRRALHMEDQADDGEIGAFAIGTRNFFVATPESKSKLSKNELFNLAAHAETVHGSSNQQAL